MIISNIWKNKNVPNHQPVEIGHVPELLLLTLIAAKLPGLLRLAHFKDHTDVHHPISVRCIVVISGKFGC